MPLSPLLHHRTAQLGSATAPLSFQTTGGGSWPIWDRFIAVDGQNIYHIGNVCGTCIFFFSKLSEQVLPLSPQHLVERLNAGLSSIEDETLETLGAILPLGKYEATLLSIQPKYVEAGQSEDYFANEQVEHWGMDPLLGTPHSPLVNYYRGEDRHLDPNSKLFEFFVPLTTPVALDRSRVDYYKAKISAGQRPTAISLTVLDIKTPCEALNPDISPEPLSHWCLTHYLLDGHHKIRAASELGAKMTLLAFIAVENGVSIKEDVGEVVKRML